MAAKATATSTGGVMKWNSDDDSWSVRSKSNAAALAATFTYDWNLAADARSNRGPGATGPKFKTSPTAGYTWPSSNKTCTGTQGSKAWADGSGYSVRDATSHWSRYKVFMTATADTKIGPSGSASSDSTVKDPWPVDYPDTGNAHVHNMLMINADLGGAVTARGRGGSAVRSGGVALTGSMGSISVGLDFTTGKLKTGVRLARGWVPYIAVPFTASGKMRAPVPATAKDIRLLLASGFDPVKVIWKSKSTMSFTFVKDVGTGAGSDDLALNISADQTAAGE